MVEVWPENWPAICLFESLSTQWRMGPAGCYGLDYAVLPAVFRLSGVRAPDRAAMFDDLRVLELAALETMRANSV